MVLVPFRTTRNLRNIIRKLENEKINLEKELRNEKNRLEEERKRLNEIIEKQRREYEKRLNDLEEKIRRYELELQAYEKLSNTYKNSIESYESRIIELEREIKEKNEKIEKLEERNRRRKEMILASKKMYKRILQRLRSERSEEKRMIRKIEKTIRDLSATLVEESFGVDLENFIENRKFYKFYERSSKSKREVFYHNDLDGIVASSLVAQYLLERFDDFPKIHSGSYEGLIDEIYRRFNKLGEGLEEVYILDIGVPPEIKRRLPYFAKKSIIITDKEYEKMKEKNGNERVKIITNTQEENKSTSELTYSYIKSIYEKFKGKNVDRLLELGRMGHKKQPDDEAKTIQLAIELIPNISDLLVLEFAENGVILDHELWRFLDYCSFIAPRIMRTIGGLYETLYEDEKNVIVAPPIYFFSNLILAEMRGKKKKNVIGLIFNGDEITLIGRYKSVKDVDELVKYLQGINATIERVHPDYVIATLKRDYENLLLDLFKKYPKNL